MLGIQGLLYFAGVCFGILIFVFGLQGWAVACSVCWVVLHSISGLASLVVNFGFQLLVIEF